MSEKKIHQSSGHEYQIRVDGKAVYYPNMMCKSTLAKWAEICEENPDCYVDIVRVSTEIIICQFEYHQMETHFNKLEQRVKK